MSTQLEQREPTLPRRLRDKVAVVTGAGSGIGRATAKLFAEEGACVAVVGNVEAACKETVAEILERQGDAISLCLDVSDRESVQSAVAQAIERYGRIDVLVNSAGIGPPDDGPIAELDELTWSRVLEVNLQGPFLFTKYVIRSALARSARSLSIVNVASIVGLVASFSDATAYAASKGGVLGLTKQVAVTYARHHFRCNAICPGPVDTPILESRITALGRAAFESKVPLERMGTAADIAPLALYLASEESSWVTGAVIAIDGGVTAI